MAEGAEAVIVAHGSPSDPGPQDAAMAALAREVSARLPGWTVRGATLAAEGSLERALAGLAAPLIYPFFMAEGYFTGRALPARLGGIGRQLPPFGTEPELADLIRQVALEAGAAGQDLILAAHGSQVSTTSKQSVLAMVDRLADGTFAEVVAGFVEEPPHLADVARGRRGVCIPFFALRAGHVSDDVPRALADAGFSGRLLPAIGEHAAVPQTIAQTLVRSACPESASGR